jgi:TctA family transporter
MLEENFRRAMLLSRGNFSTFVTHPISGTLLAIIAALIGWQMVASARGRRAVSVAAVTSSEA